MKILDTPLAGLKTFEIEPITDSRGFFARTFCAAEAAAAGLESAVAQCSVSVNPRAGTLRGLHWQAPPYGEDKLVRCTAGAAFDVAVDIRRGSPTYGQWFGIYLTPFNRRALFIPAGFAHGFLTLDDDTEMLYQISTSHVPQTGRGLRWNDPLINVAWPAEPVVLSDRDAGLPPLDAVSDEDLFQQQ